ncbi:hypothetical protein AC1031_000099 [Aphanomyces cochlioides]|nr:hypothetical protein AC1031_000099 [Aphanomyces cochlioides]
MNQSQQPLPLLRLAKICDWGGLRKAMDKASQDAVEATDEYGMHVLHWAVTEANIPIGLLEYLIRVFPQGVRLFSNGGFLPIHLALMAGASVARVQRLVESFPQSTMIAIPSGHTPYLIYFEHLPMDTQALKRADGQTAHAAHNVHVWGNILVGHVLKTTNTSIPTLGAANVRSNRSKSRRHSSSSVPLYSASPVMLRSELKAEESSMVDWRELGRRMALQDPTLDDIIEDKSYLVVQATLKAPFELFEWLVHLCCDSVRIKNNAGMLPLHIAVTHHASARRLGKLVQAYPESVHALTRQGDTAWSLAQKLHADPTVLDVLHPSNRAMAQAA